VAVEFFFKEEANACIGRVPSAIYSNF
jgi:hypothetical protein